MAEHPVTVIADDLTGACEIAAIGLKYGLRSLVSIEREKGSHEADLMVHDTETRLDSPASSVVKLTSTLDLLKGARRPIHLYKKVDSVLRGPISAELNLLAKRLGFERVLLIPANPGLGRTIRGGFYRIKGEPLHETAFANDLHHPARSSWVVDLLGRSCPLAVHRCGLDETLPGAGLVIGDADSRQDLERWAARLDSGTLAAGAAAFFEPVLRQWLGRQWQDRAGDFAPEGPVLLVSGTTAPGQIRAMQALAGPVGPGVGLDFMRLESDLAGILNQIAGCLERHGRALVHMRDASRADPRNACKVRASLARIAHHFAATGTLRHLVVEGGATAAAVAGELGWKALVAVHEWAPGVVSLRPTARSDMVYTMKPGSYPWPGGFGRILFP
jgi:uncharacterized protein YgbK (DUF1537 family)